MLAGSPDLACIGSDTPFAPAARRMGVAQSERRRHVVVVRDPYPTVVLFEASHERQGRRCVRRDDYCVAPAAEAASDQCTRPGRAAPVGITRGERCGVRPLRCCCLPMPTVIERHRHRGLPAVGSHRIPAYATGADVSLIFA